MSKTVEVFRTEMQRLAEQLPKYPIVVSLYGVGGSLGPQLMVEIDNVPTNGPWPPLPELTRE